MSLMNLTIVRLTAVVVFIDCSLPLHNCSVMTIFIIIIIIIVQVENPETEGIRSEVSEL